jgi:hypothetical protein
MSGIRSLKPEQHARMTTSFEHLNPHHAPTTVHVPISFSIAPTMTTIIVNRVPVVNPKFTSVI